MLFFSSVPGKMDTSGLVTAMLLVALLATLASAVDVRVGEDVTLECRFNPILMDKRHTFYWIRQNIKEKDNVAIGESPLEKNYRISFKPAEGQYDLIVSGATYDRDNGRFECRLKEQGTGIELHAQSVDLVVLVPPAAPQINPVSPVGVEGQPTELVCSSLGGSPDPVLRWYRKGESNPLDGAVMKPGGSRTVASVSTLVVRPQKEDDGSEYRCVAWNRAMDPNDKKEATVSLAVNYAPRVKVNQSPLSVEKGGSIQISCQVDSKPAVYNVRWTRSGRYIASSFNHTLRSVTLDDDGVYTCSADNGLGQIGEAQLQLDVLHAPLVTINGDSRKEVDIGASVAIPCNVSAKPAPTTVEWLKEGDNQFRQTGPVLRLTRVSAADNGRYLCRATNVISGNERSSNATFQLLVRHEPGSARITPEEPIAVDEASITLTCTADPPGWPVPQYRWWKAGSESTILAVSSELTLPVARQNSEGTYYCQPSNELGTGGSSYVNLRVHQPPRFISQLPPTVQRKALDTEFNVTCSAQGKPKPSIVWLKDGVEILPAGSGAYELVTDESEGRNSIFTVRSTLRFFGSERPSLNQLTADDRGIYTCAFENQVRRIESLLNLKIEHAPILLDHKPKVASNVGSNSAYLACQVKAYPSPNFEWSFRNVPIKGGSVEGGKYETNVTLIGGPTHDVYRGILRIGDINDADYGDYSCKIANAEGETAAAVRLQPTSAPEKPTNLRVAQAGYDSLTVAWDAGFDGGYENTIYTVLYRSADSNVRENDCQRANPCAIHGLEQLQSYTFQVRAENAKGKSPVSGQLTASTVIDLSRIPEAKQVTFEPKSKTISFHVESPLTLIALVESRFDGDWMPSQKIPVRTPVSHEVLDQVKDEAEDVRIRLCLEANSTLCSEPVVAVIGSLIQPTKAVTQLPTKYVVAIVTACVVGSLAFIMFAFFYCFRRRKAHKLRKLLEMEKAHGNSSRPTMNQQPPPPYYAGLENKGRDLDTTHGSAMMDDAGSKNALYATQNGYGYAVANGGTNAGADWVNLAYTEHSYSNSNNGGSVNSQDSLWQLKMAQNGGGGGGGAAEHQMPMNTGTLQQSYHYDPMTHGGYGGFEDYSHYPPSNGDDYLNQRNNYAVTGNGDPYASVHKNGKRMDHLESAYHNVSGLPDPYMEHDPEEMAKQQQQQHHQQQQHQQLHQQQQPQQGQQGVSLSFDESLESGYSTPNSRNRRVIREIIV